MRVAGDHLPGIVPDTVMPPEFAPAPAPSPAPASASRDSTVASSKPEGRASGQAWHLKHDASNVGPATALLVAPGPVGYFSHIPALSNTPLRLQPKLAIGAGDDPQEREADQMAQRILQMAPARSTPCHCRTGSTAPCSSPGCKLRRKAGPGPAPATQKAPQAVIDTLRGSGQALEPEVQSFMSSRMGHDFSHVRVHVDQASAPAIGAQAYTVGPHIAFAPGRYRPHSNEGKQLLAHELTHVMQQAQGGDATVQRAPETWLRGEAAGVAPAAPGGVVHDFGDGLYLTDEPALAAEYANLRAGNNPAAGRVVAATFERSLLGRILNLNTDPRWAAYMSERTPSGSLTHLDLIRMANENYWSFFQEFLRRYNLRLENFDSIIGPEYVRSGNQLCVRNPSIAAQIRALLAPPVAAPAPAEAPAQYPVRSQFRVTSSEPLPGGHVFSEVEVTLGEGLENMNQRIGASGARNVPNRFVLRITTDAQGALVAAESSSAEAAALTETLARQALAAIPRAGATEGAAVAGAGAAASSAARPVSPWVRGASWAGLVLFTAVTIYRYNHAAPAQRPRVLAQAGGGLGLGMAGGYVVCNLILGIETVGWSLLICGAVVGIPTGIAGEAAAGAIYDEATIGDVEIRNWVASHELSRIGSLPTREKLRFIFSLMHGYISDADVEGIVRILQSVTSASELSILQSSVGPHLNDMYSSRQRELVRQALQRQL